ARAIPPRRAKPMMSGFFMIRFSLCPSHLGGPAAGCQTTETSRGSVQNPPCVVFFQPHYTTGCNPAYGFSDLILTSSSCRPFCRPERPPCRRQRPRSCRPHHQPQRPRPCRQPCRRPQWPQRPCLHRPSWPPQQPCPPPPSSSPPP